MSGRYLVIAECIDSRTGKRFKEGEEFLPAPTAEQALRLEKAGCLSGIPDSAPVLPGSDAKTLEIADLKSTVEAREKTIVELRGTIAGNAIKAGSEVSALNKKLDEANEAQSKLFEDFQTVRDQLDTTEKELDDVRVARDGLATEKGALTERVAELERLLEAATKPVDGAGDQAASQTAPAKPKRT